jgi:uncharacterized membrane protein YcaP (DUF421 family)
MENQEPIRVFDWKRIFLTHDAPIDFFLEIVLRTGIMFVFLVVLLKLLGKRGLQQLSVFELAILIALGSGSGDPMFYPNVPVLYGFLVIILVVLLYRFIIFIASKNIRLERFIEGRPACILSEGKMLREQFKKETLPAEKFFGELRTNNIEHLGQVKKVYLETSGSLSIYYHADHEVKPGLPIAPERLAAPLIRIESSAEYACIRCGNVQRLESGAHKSCEVCDGDKWLSPLATTRIS